MKLIIVICVIVAVPVQCLGDTKKILERTLFTATEQSFRYSEGAVLDLDAKKELLMVVSVFSVGGHDNSPAQLLAWRSHDGGLTWGEQFIFQENIGKQNVMIPSFLRLSKDEVLFFFLVTNSLQDAGTWLRRSKDNGKTWAEPVKLPYKGYGNASNQHVLRLKSGRIVVPYWVSYDSLGSSFSFSFYSDDRGYTWRRSNEITVNLPSKGRKTSPAAEEPAIIELKDGSLLMFMRTYVGSFYKSFSKDGGASWSSPVNSGISAPGAMPTLARIPNRGDILLIFNYGDPDEIDGPWPRNRIATAVSKDQGNSFTSFRILDGDKDFAGKMTMANVTFIENNALVFYSKSPTKKNLYSWMQQIIPIQWFYEGDSTRSLGKSHRAGMMPN